MMATFYIFISLMTLLFVSGIVASFYNIFKNAKKAMKQKEYINEMNAELRDNIDDFEVNEVVIDKDKAECTITNKDYSSIEVFIKKKKKESINKKKKEGINSKEWFYIKDFNKRFKKKQVIIETTEEIIENEN